MTVILIEKKNHGLKFKGDTATIENVKAINEKADNVVELVKGKNWQILCNKQFTQIVIL